MKRRLVLSTALVVTLLILLPLIAGCDVTGQQTTATLGEPTAEATEADNAIAEVTKSANIEVPANIEGGVLKAGSDVAFPPLAYLANVQVIVEGETKSVVTPVGFEVDLCTAIAKKMGLTLEVLSAVWDELVPALEDKKVDMIMSAVVITPELEQEVAFTAPHLSADLAISTPLGAPIADSTGLAGKIVGVQLNSLGHSQVMEITGVAEIKTYSTIVKAFDDLAKGRIQVVVDDAIVSAFILKNDEQLKEKVANTGAIATGTGYALATRKEDAALLAAVNTALAELRAEGVYEKICGKWGLTGN